MSVYAIGGGSSGKARLHVISDALRRSTDAVLGEAGVEEGSRCLDLGCGGGDVTMLLAGMVGPRGRVLGIDQDPVKIELARADAESAGIDNVEFRVGDASDPLPGGFDVVYARLLLTHLSDPLHCLVAMAAAVNRAGRVVVEDMEHSAVFARPHSEALSGYLGIYDQTVRRRGGDPDIGPRLPALFDQAGLAVESLFAVQPIHRVGEAKAIHQITLRNILGTVVAEQVATAEALADLESELDAVTADPDTLVAFPRIYQVIGSPRT